MTYSCAIFDADHTTLEAAQVNKIRTILQKAKIKKGMHILEIGSGWGALAIEVIILLLNNRCSHCYHHHHHRR